MTQKEFHPNEEGIFALPDHIYHNHKLAPEVNRGLVVQMITTSAAHVKASIDGKSKKKTTRAMDVGVLLDKALLEPDRFKEGLSHWIKPEELDLKTKAGIAWKKDHPGLPYLPPHTESLTIVSEADIKGMIESVMKHKQARKIVELSIKQESAFCKDKDTGVLRKCRPDARLIDVSSRLVLGDLKSTYPGGAADEALSQHVSRMGYHIQDPFYSDVYKDLFGEEPFFIFFVVERKPPYAVRVFQIHEEGRQVGRNEYKKALEQYRKCKATGIWPAYSEEIEIIRLPRYKLRPPDPVVIG